MRTREKRDRKSWFYKEKAQKRKVLCQNEDGASTTMKRFLKLISHPSR
eukprot:jgi/Antlo1/1809/17